MADIKKGSICRSLAGHDKGTYYIIVETGNVIKVSDGKYRPLSNPKVKNLKHLEIVDYEDKEIYPIPVDWCNRPLIQCL